MKPFSPAKPVFFISTHLDDVALSCSRFIHANPGACVLTVFAGAPPGKRKGYNRETTGEKYALAAVQKRRDEDAAALSMLGATHIWLDLWDNDYVNADPRTADKQEIMDLVSRALRDGNAGSVVAPIGFVHPDHIAVSAACIELSTGSNLEWYFYTDMPYAHTWPEKRIERLQQISAQLELAPLEPYVGDGTVKHEIIKLYRSQYGPASREPGFAASMAAPEEYWRVVVGS